MLRIFRKLRSDTLSKGRIRKYVLYVLGELVLIVAGIIIAVQLNNVNTNRKLRDSERLYLDRLVSDLKSDLSRFNFLDSMNNLSLTECEALLEDIQQPLTKKQKLDIVSQGFLNFYSLNPNTSTYDEMVNTGKLYTTSSPAIRAKIIYYYNNLEKDITYFQNGNARVKLYMDGEDMRDYWLLKRRIYNDLPAPNSEFAWLSKTSSPEWKAFETTLYIYQSSLKKNKVRLINLQKTAESAISALQEDLK